MSSKYEASGTICEAVSGKEDHGIQHVTLTVKFDEWDGGTHQGFQMCVKNVQQRKLLEKRLCETFDVKKFDGLEGEECFALYCFAEHNAMIEGLRSRKTGKTFTRIDFCVEDLKIDVSTPLDSKIKSLSDDIVWAGLRVEKAKTELKTVGAAYRAISRFEQRGTPRKGLKK